MRYLVIAAAAALLLLPVSVPSQACGAGMHSAKATSADYSAKHKKKIKKTAKVKKEKVEYMRTAPMK